MKSLLLKRLTLDDAPRVAPAAHFPPVDLDHRVGADDGERDALAHRLLRLAQLLVVHVRKLVDLDLVLGDLVEDLSRGGDGRVSHANRRGRAQRETRTCFLK